jgi:hypothetical protein
MKTRVSFRPYSYRLPVYLALAGVFAGALWDFACPQRVDGQTASAEAYTLAMGPLSQTETEREECYATIGFNPKQGFMIAAPPQAVVCMRLRELAARGVRVRLVLEVER